MRYVHVPPNGSGWAGDARNEPRRALHGFEVQGNLHAAHRFRPGGAAVANPVGVRVPSPRDATSDNDRHRTAASTTDFRRLCHLRHARDAVCRFGQAVANHDDDSASTPTAATIQMIQRIRLSGVGAVQQAHSRVQLDAGRDRRCRCSRLLPASSRQPKLGAGSRKLDAQNVKRAPSWMRRALFVAPVSLPKLVFVCAPVT